MLPCYFTIYSPFLVIYSMPHCLLFEKIKQMSNMKYKQRAFYTCVSVYTVSLKAKIEQGRAIR